MDIKFINGNTENNNILSSHISLNKLLEYEKNQISNFRCLECSLIPEISLNYNDNTENDYKDKIQIHYKCENNHEGIIPINDFLLKATDNDIYNHFVQIIIIINKKIELHLFIVLNVIYFFVQNVIKNIKKNIINFVKLMNLIINVKFIINHIQNIVLIVLKIFVKNV